MANSDVRLRVEEFRRSWMAERDAAIAEAVEEAGQVVEMAIRLERPTAALSALELKLKLRGIVHDRRFSLYTESPDDDLSTCLFDPREDEDPPLEPLPEAPAPPAEPLLPEPVEQPEVVKAADPAEPPATPPEPVSEPAPTAAAETGAAPAAVPPRAASAPVLRIPPVPARVLETFDIDPKAFPTVCPAIPRNHSRRDRGARPVTQLAFSGLRPGSRSDLRGPPHDSGLPARQFSSPAAAAGRR